MELAGGLGRLPCGLLALRIGISVDCGDALPLSGTGNRDNPRAKTPRRKEDKELEFWRGQTGMIELAK
jgi:hypothetical protein